MAKYKYDGSAASKALQKRHNGKRQSFSCTTLLLVLSACILGPMIYLNTMAISNNHSTSNQHSSRSKEQLLASVPSTQQQRSSNLRQLVPDQPVFSGASAQAQKQGIANPAAEAETGPQEDLGTLRIDTGASLKKMQNDKNPVQQEWQAPLEPEINHRPPIDHHKPNKLQRPVSFQIKPLPIVKRDGANIHQDAVGKDHASSKQEVVEENSLFGTPLEQLEVRTIKEEDPPSTKHRGVIAVMCTSLDKDIKDLKGALKQIAGSFVNKHHYPVAVVHEDFSEKLMRQVQDAAPSVYLYFVKVRFKVPTHLQPHYHEGAKKTVMHWTGHKSSTPHVGYHTHEHGLNPWNKRQGSYPFGYQHMCRFYAGAGFLLPFFAAFDYYMRLDSDSSCTGNIEDVFDKLDRENLDYLWNMEKNEGGDVVEGLYHSAERFIKDNGVQPTFYNQEMPTKQYPDCRNTGGDQRAKQETHTERRGGKEVEVRGCEHNLFHPIKMFYNNFEVVRLSVLRGEAYQAWFRHVDAEGGIYLHRWGDAPLRWLGLSMFVSKSRIKKVGYCKHP